MYLHIYLSVNLCFWEEKQKNVGLVALLAVRGICLRTYEHEWVVCDSICMCVSVSQCMRNSISDRVLTAVKIHSTLLLLLLDPKDPPLPPNNTPTPSGVVFTDHMRSSVRYNPRNQVVDSDQPTMYCVIHKLYNVVGGNPGDAVAYQQGEK